MSKENRALVPVSFRATREIDDEVVEGDVREVRSGKWEALAVLGKPGLMLIMMPLLMGMVVGSIVMMNHWKAVDAGVFGLMQLGMLLAYGVLIVLFIAFCVVVGTLLWRFVSRCPMRVAHHKPGAPVAVVEIGGKIVEPTNYHPQPLSQVRSISISQSRAVPEPVLEEPEDLPALPPARLSARELIEQGRVGRGDILLGVNAQGAEIRRTQKEFISYFIAGVQGGGKTSTAIWLLSQALLAGGQMALIDFDATAEEGMYQKIRCFESAFAVPVGDTPEKALQVIACARNLLERRIAGLEPASYLFVLVVDEFSDLMRHRGRPTPAGQAADELADLLEFVNSRGRKRLVSVICIGQATNASRSGGSEVRDLFNERLAHAMQEKQAQLLGLTEYKQAIARLGKGEIYADLRGYPEPFLVFVPYETGDDIRLVSQRLPLYAPGMYRPSQVSYAPFGPGSDDTTNVYPQLAPTQPTSPGMPELPYKLGRERIEVTGTGPQIAAALADGSLSALSAPEPPKIAPKRAQTPEERERERIIEAIHEHPEWSASRIAVYLGFRNNNKITLIKSIKEELLEAEQEGSA